MSILGFQCIFMYLIYMGYCKLFQMITKTKGKKNELKLYRYKNLSHLERFGTTIINETTSTNKPENKFINSYIVYKTFLLMFFFKVWVGGQICKTKYITSKQL